jgi:2-dehydropantoate 2-reductase
MRMRTSTISRAISRTPPSVMGKSVFVLAALSLPALFVLNVSAFHVTTTTTVRSTPCHRWKPSTSALHMSVPTNPTVAVVGSGAVGGYYGARLWEAGYTVKFHMRGEHFQAAKANGLTVTSVDGDVVIPPELLQAFERTADMGQVDWVIVALKSSALDAIPDLIRPLLRENTRVLNIMNGLIEEDLLRGLNGDSLDLTCCAAVYGGMALLCSNRIAPGCIDHSYAGLLSAGVAASSSNANATDTHEEHKLAFQQLWEPTKVDTTWEESLLRGRWKKNVWNLPFNGISVAMGGITIDVVVNDPGLRKLAYAVMDETIAVANADLAQQGYDESFFLGEAEKKQMMDLSDAMGPYRTSTMLDLVERRKMEVSYLFRAALLRAERLDVHVPHFATLVAQIEAMQRMYNL